MAWRIKTKEEFKNEYGPDWRDVLRWSSTKDVIFGLEMPIEMARQINAGHISDSLTWTNALKSPVTELVNSSEILRNLIGWDITKYMLIEEPEIEF